MEERQYQQDAIAFLAKSKRGIVEAPAGAGKTHIAASALAVCLSKRQQVADVEIMVNTVEQVDQMQTACDRFAVIAKKSRLEIYCAAGAPQGTNPNLLIVDECHRAGADGWRTKIEQCKSARWGLSATPFSGDKERDSVVRDLFGNNIHKIGRQQLVDEGHLAKAVVLWHKIECEQITAAIHLLTTDLLTARRKKMPWMFSTPDAAEQQFNQCKWQAAQKLGIWENQLRDAQVAGLAQQSVKAGSHTIVLIGSVDHGRRLLKAIPGAMLVNSKMSAKQRAKTIALFRAGDLRCMIGTSAIEEGFDAPIANCIIMAACGRSKRKTIQSTGRVLRPHDGKNSGIIHDFDDHTHPMLLRQSKARAAIYRQLNYAQKLY